MVAGRLRVYLSFFAVSLAMGGGAGLAQAQEAVSWEWQAVTGTECRDGSEAGFFLRRRSFDKRLVVYLEGGGACFNSLTCGQNPKAVGDQFPGREGIFQERDDNPVSGWNFVHVPYCSGDIYAGTQKGITVPGVSGKQSFMGYRNMQKILDQLQQTMPDLETVLITGVSAGGFGAIFHLPNVKQRWPDSKAVLLDDSGIPLEDSVLAPCLQQKFRDLWGVDAALPEDCPACRGERGGGLVELAKWLKQSYGDGYKGIIMSLQDNTLRFFFGFGLNECRPPLIPSIAGQVFEAGVRSLRDNYLKEGIASFVQAGSQHTFIGSKSFYETKQSGQNIASWVQDLLNNQAQDRGP